MPKSKKKAFTLTELLVVVVIIGVLAAVVLPKFNKVVETRKTTEAEEIMAAVRTEQEHRCALDKPYVGNIAKLVKSEVLRTADTKNYTYSLEETGMLASSKGKYAYTLKMPSYADGRVCCEGAECNKLNKDYPSCAELEAKPDYKLATQCTAELPSCDNSHTEGQIATETACGCGTKRYTRWTCNGSSWETFVDNSSCRDVSAQRATCESNFGTWNDETCSCNGCMSIPGNQEKEWNCIDFNGNALPQVEGTWNRDTCTCSCPGDFTLNADGECMSRCNNVTDLSHCLYGDRAQNAVPGTWNESTCSCTCPAGSTLENGMCVKKCTADNPDWVQPIDECEDPRGEILQGYDAHGYPYYAEIPGTWNTNTCKCDCPQAQDFAMEIYGDGLQCYSHCNPERWEQDIEACRYGTPPYSTDGRAVPGLWHEAECRCMCPTGRGAKSDGHGGCYLPNCTDSPRTRSLGDIWAGDRAACTLETEKQIGNNNGCPSGAYYTGAHVISWGHQDPAAECVYYPGQWDEENCRCNCPKGTRLNSLGLKCVRKTGTSASEVDVCNNDQCDYSSIADQIWEDMMSQDEYYDQNDDERDSGRDDDYEYDYGYD